MSTVKVDVLEFRKRLESFLESDTPVHVTRRGETIGVYLPIGRKRISPEELSKLRAAADRLAEALADVDEEEFVADFERFRKQATRQRSSDPST